MQWVVTTGRTVEEARERALDALGIDDSDLEVEVLAEPRSRLFGLRRTDARVRARVRPTRPRPKVDRRNRRKGAGSGGRRRRAPREDVQDRATANGGAAPERTAAEGTGGGGRNRRRNRSARERSDAEATTPDDATPSGPSDTPGLAEAPVAEGARAPVDQPAPTPPRPEVQTDDSEPLTGTTGESMSDITLDEQEPSALGFVQGLVDAFGVDADVQATSEDDEHLEIAVTGDDLGLLVGPRGATLNAIQELTRTAVAQQHSGRLQGRLRVDVAGYRARRKEALERFAAQQAERVRETGTAVALEPMSPPDRKIVHDAVNEIDGVRTTSEGEDRRRHVVILPD
ncbi:MAG: RNA-binding cell elongation regulator Jag/EloR [Acidimicrobiia bacterium]